MTLSAATASETAPRIVIHDTGESPAQLAATIRGAAALIRKHGLYRHNLWRGADAGRPWRDEPLSVTAALAVQMQYVTHRSISLNVIRDPWGTDVTLIHPALAAVARHRRDVDPYGVDHWSDTMARFRDGAETVARELEMLAADLAVGRAA